MIVPFGSKTSWYRCAQHPSSGSGSSSSSSSSSRSRSRSRSSSSSSSRNCRDLRADMFIAVSLLARSSDHRVVFLAHLRSLCGHYADTMRTLCGHYRWVADTKRTLCGHYRWVADTMRTLCGHYADTMRTVSFFDFGPNFGLVVGSLGRLARRIAHRSFAFARRIVHYGVFSNDFGGERRGPRRAPRRRQRSGRAGHRQQFVRRSAVLAL